MESKCLCLIWFAEKDNNSLAHSVSLFDGHDIKIVSKRSIVYTGGLGGRSFFQSLMPEDRG